MMSPHLTADQQLSLAYAKPSQAALYRALFGLDAAMAQIALTAHEPLLAQIKLAWWAEAGLTSLKGGSAIGDAVLGVQAVADHRQVVPPFVEAWKAAADGPEYFDEASRLRAEAWMSALGCADDAMASALQAWANLDLKLMTGANEKGLKKSDLLALKRHAKPIAVLALLASCDAALPQEQRSKPGSPKRMLRAFLFGAFGLIL
jgi:15-cis-phytoene synthase